MKPDSRSLFSNPALRDPRRWAPTLLAVLAVANLIAAWFVWRTPGGSSDLLESEAADARIQVQRAGTNLSRVRALVKKVETARADQERFVNRYFIDRRTASSTILSELGNAAARAGLAPREHSFTVDPIEGSDSFSMMNIAANYEGRYSDLRKFINSLDRSQRFLIIEDVTAVPEQEPGKLTARFRINAFVRDGGPPTPAVPQEPVTPPLTPPAGSSVPTAGGSGPVLVAPGTPAQLPGQPAGVPAQVPSVQPLGRAPQEVPAPLNPGSRTGRSRRATPPPAAPAAELRPNRTPAIPDRGGDASLKLAVLGPSPVTQSAAEKRQ